MLSLHKINPMVRAIGTMGAVAALIGGITFASLSTPAVALSPNNLVTSTAGLSIGAAGTCPGGDTTATPGFTTSTPMTPGGPAVTASFCLDNTGNIPLTVTASIPTLPTGTAATYTALSITCTTEGTVGPQTLSTWTGGAFSAPIPAGASDSCTASAALNASYPGSGGEAIPSFDIDFVGNQ